MNRLLFVSAFLFLGTSLSRADELTDKVDKLFARWDKKTTPGCAIGVIRDGKLIYEKAYGMADLEQGSPITTDTVFHIASISKQFTAFAILLLEKDGKLSLDDDIRKHLPELHDFGKPITIRQLLLHTSGLRDQWSLLTLAGWRMDDVITDDDIFRLACRQRELNFPPGDRHLYSNMGYTLAAIIVERVSGMPFRKFTWKRIFEPLGMTKTRFPSDHEEIIPGRARSYQTSGHGTYKNSVLSYSNAGATSLLTTVGDLAKWDQNFYEPKVGDAKLIERFQERGKLNNKRAISYALGLDTGTYRGLKYVEHGGADAGFRCELMRFPSERFSVIILANSSDSGPRMQAQRVADLYLSDKLKPLLANDKPKPPAERKVVAVDPALFDAYAGEYRVFAGLTVTVTRDGNRLMGKAPGTQTVELAATSDRSFFVPGEEIEVTFEKPVDGKCPSITLTVGGNPLPAKRFTHKTMTPQQAEEYVGDYYSDELGVIYTVARREGTLTLRFPRGEREMLLETGNTFEAAAPVGTVTFTRDKEGKVTGFKIDSDRVLNVRFERVQIKKVE